MNKYSLNFENRINKNNSRIILPEEDPRINEAKRELIKKNIKIVNIKYQKKNLEYISKCEFTKNWTNDMKYEYLLDPINLGCTMVACNDADAIVAGATVATSKVLRSAIRIIGMKKNINWISSIFFLVSPDKNIGYTFTDCAVIPDPNSDQLVEIAFESSKFHELLTNEKPRLAFLSFSTFGSAKHYRVERVQRAVSKFKKKYPEIISEGEIQFDAAIVPEIAIKKNPNSQLKGKANVFIFPNLDAANIAYKMMQRIANYSAWGPLLQGFKKPIHDLSRGCTVEDIINVCLIACMQKGKSANI